MIWKPAVRFSLTFPIFFMAACGGGGGSTPPPTLDTRQIIQLRYDDDSKYDTEGVKVFIDDALVGTTDATGELRVAMTPGSHRVRALDQGLGSGQTDVAVDGSAGAVEVTLHGDLERSAAVSCPEAVGGFIPANTATVTLMVSGVNAAVPVTIETFQVSVSDARAPSAPIDVSAFFARSDATLGQLAVTNSALLFGAIAGINNDLLVAVKGTDADGAEFNARTSFFVGRHRLDIALVAPPSRPALVVAGVPVVARLIGTQVEFDGVSDAQGHVSFTPIPTGTYELSAATNEGAATYAGNTAQFVAANGAIGLMMLGLTDVLAGVSPTTGYQFTGAIYPRLGPIPPSTFETSVDTGAISVTSAMQNHAVVNDTTATFAQGTKKAKLVFTVVSVEYPFYVLSQSVFNDNWTLRVLSASGQTLFSRVRNVNSQISIEPLWMVGTAPGTTGTIEEEIDIAALTATGSAAVSLAISATNIGDSLLPTTVTASLQPSDFRIKSIAATPVTPNYSCNQHTKPQTEQTRFSFPFTPAVNFDQRKLLVDLIGRPDSAPMSRVRVELMANGNVLATILDEAPSDTGRVRSVTGTAIDRLEVTVTSSAAHPSPLQSTPTPPHQVTYRLTVEVSGGSSGTLTAEKNSPIYGALWKAQLADRSGCRDDGGDEWASVATLAWLANNLSLLGAVNDISGEHDRNLGHSTHNGGRAIDFRQYTTPDFPAASGLQLFKNVRDATLNAINGNAGELAKVNAWFAVNRNGLGALADLPSVEVIYVAASPAATKPFGVGLPTGWFHELLTSGSTTSGTTTLSLPIGDWTNANEGKVRPLDGHSDHHHVALNL